MGNILVINSTLSPKEKSFSATLASEFKKAYLTFNSDDIWTEIDLNNHPLALEPLYAKNIDQFFDNGIELINQLKQTNKLVIASPAINFTFPATLKNYLDRIIMINETFKVTKNAKTNENHLVGLLNNLTCVFLSTQGEKYEKKGDWTHTDLLIDIFNFLGAKTLGSIIIGETNRTKHAHKTVTQRVLEYSDQINLLARKLSQT